MTRFITLLLLEIAVFWILFLRKPAMQKTLAAWRWMILAWTGLALMAVLTPITYNSMTINISTVLYCTLWVGGFCVADELTFRRGYLRVSSQEQRGQRVGTTSVLSDPMVLAWLYAISVTGVLILLSHDFELFVSAIQDPFNLATVRTDAGNAEGSMFLTMGSFFASLGLPTACIHLVVRIKAQRSPPMISFAGILAYFFTYILTAGRQGILIGMMTLMITLATSLQILSLPYRHIKRIYCIAIALVCGAISYHLVITNYRSVGGSDSFDWKIGYQNALYNCSTDEESLSSLEVLGRAGNGVIEMFYYFSPQLYGLSESLETPLSGHSLGAAQFPYVTRRIEMLMGRGISDKHIAEIDDIFVSTGVFSHFFRTAVEGTYMDFGKIGGVLFVCLMGAAAGWLRSVSIAEKSAEHVVTSALVCTGAAYTIIYSPFVENGFAFPFIGLLICFMIRRLVPLRTTTAWVRRTSKTAVHFPI